MSFVYIIYIYYYHEGPRVVVHLFSPCLWFAVVIWSNDSHSQAIVVTIVIPGNRPHDDDASKVSYLPGYSSPGACWNIKEAYPE